LQKHIFIIRHGETDFNQQGIVQGSSIDSSLNEKGRTQAKAFYAKYKNHFFDKIYISELQRTWQTIAQFAEKGIPVEKHKGLNEISWGKFEGKKIADSPKPYFDKLIDSWHKGDTHLAIEGGESPNDVAKRQKPVIDLILSRKEEKQVLICMHGRAMRIFLCQLLHKPLSKMDMFKHSNTCLYHLVYNYADNSIYAHLENCLRHLD
jgi:probable phosphoglycerate mutase